MSNDKRSVSTDALETLGTIIDENQKRDAIHLAVIAVQAGEILYPGQDIGIGEDGKAYINNGWDFKQIGIVDPFLKENLGVQIGQWFWLVIYPRQVTSLRHVWTHPDIPDSVETTNTDSSSTPKKNSELWLRNFLLSLDVNPDGRPYDVDDSGEGTTIYEDVLRAAGSTDHRYRGSDKLSFGFDIYGVIPDEFWGHVETILGKSIPKEERATGFSCAC